METVSKRAFHRNFYEAKIEYAFFNSKQFFQAKVYNTSEGGMYFESDVDLAPGSDIFIKMANYKPETHGPQCFDGYRAEVMWCRKIYKTDIPSCYGIGVRFMVNTCQHCGNRFPHKDIHKTDNFLFLCTRCLRNLEDMPDGSIKECIEEYLIGNVL